MARESSSSDIATRLIEVITDRFWLLAQHPQIGRRRDADLRPGLRSIEGKDVLILHLMRGSRDIAGLLER